MTKICTYQMTQGQFERMMELSHEPKGVPIDFWVKLGLEMGFNPMTVMPSYGGNHLWFNAEPIDSNNPEHGTEKITITSRFDEVDDKTVIRIERHEDGKSQETFEKRFSGSRGKIEPWLKKVLDEQFKHLHGADS